MRHPFPLLTAFALFAAAGGALADEPPSTVLDYATAIGASAARLDLQIAERQRAGDMAAAQRLVLVAAMARRAGEEFRGAEQNALNDPIASLPAPLPQRIEAALAKAAEAERRAAGEAGFPDEAHVTFNALIAALPIKTPHPVLYGMLSADLAGKDAPHGHDIVIYGYRVIDPYLKSPPTVLYGKSEIDASQVQVKDDRIEVTLPEAVKKAVGFAPSPCDSRLSFGLRVREYYSEEHGLWPIVWHSQGWNNTDFYALPTPVFYSAAIVATAETSSSKSAPVNFRQRSTLTVADCEQIRSAEVLLPLPEDAHDASCSATWIGATGQVKLTARCAIEGRNVHAYGEITGGPKICSPENLCTCALQAQGWLEATGSYSVVETTSEVNVAADWPPLVFPAGGVAQGRISVGDKQKLHHVTLNVTRRACPAALDTIDLTVGDDPEAKATGVSRTGAFRASYHGGQIAVGAADALASSGERTP